MTIYRDFKMPCLRQFTEILQCLEVSGELDLYDRHRYFPGELDILEKIRPGELSWNLYMEIENEIVVRLEIKSRI